MPTSTVESRSIPNENGGNEYGITNVSSQGRVSITVVPPRAHASRSRSRTPFDRTRSISRTRQHVEIAANRSGSTYRDSPPEVTSGGGAQSAGNSTTDRLSLRELYYRRKLLNAGHEQQELDEILRELLGDTEELRARSPRRTNVSSTRSSDSGVSHKGSSSDPTAQQWLEQQQRKLNQRQQSREIDDITQLHRQQKQLVSELKHVQTKRKESLGDPDLNANVMFSRYDATDGVYRTEAQVPVTSQEPEAYTVFIKPEELRRAQEETKTNVMQRSLTNVSHTHHNHYSFHDNSDEVFENGMKQIMEDQKRRIQQLEDELQKVKMGLEDQPPVRPQKLNLDEEEDEEFLFKPVGIASLESGTGGPVAIQSSSPLAATGSSPLTPTHPAVTNTANFSTQQRAAGNGPMQSHTLNSQSGYSTGSSVHPQMGVVLSPSVAGDQMSPVPRSLYQLLPTTVPPQFNDHIPVSNPGGQRRVVMEERHHQQHIYQPPPGGHVGTLSSQPSTFSQTMRQQSASYGFTNHNAVASPTLPGRGHQPNNHALQVNTNGAQANSGGVTYATISGSEPGSPSGHAQFNDSSAGTEQSQHSAKFVKDTSKFWYKPNITREEAISLLKNSSPGTFIVRDSNSYHGAFGLAVKVAQLPPNVQIKPGADPSSEYVRFYLIEPTSKGVKLKGCNDEPVFASLASLIYQHTLTALALPCKLLLPDPDHYQFKSQSSISAVDELDGGALDSPGMVNGGETLSTASDLLKRGAACNVVYMNNVDTESLTGPQAISRAVHQTFAKEVLETTVATFKVSADGITITDNNRKLFFRQHFPKDSISYCGVDSADRRFTQRLGSSDIQEAKIFGFVAKKKGGNQCLLFAELDPDQPASAIINFINKVLLGRR